MKSYFSNNFPALHIRGLFGQSSPFTTLCYLIIPEITSLLVFIGRQSHQVSFDRCRATKIPERNTALYWYCEMGCLQFEPTQEQGGTEGVLEAEYSLGLLCRECDTNHKYHYNQMFDVHGVNQSKMTCHGNTGKFPRTFSLGQDDSKTKPPYTCF